MQAFLQLINIYPHHSNGDILVVHVKKMITVLKYTQLYQGRGTVLHSQPQVVQHEYFHTNFHTNLITFFPSVSQLSLCGPAFYSSRNTLHIPGT